MARTQVDVDLTKIKNNKRNVKNIKIKINQEQRQEQRQEQQKSITTAFWKLRQHRKNNTVVMESRRDLAYWHCYGPNLQGQTTADDNTRHTKY